MKHFTLYMLIAAIIIMSACTAEPSAAADTGAAERVIPVHTTPAGTGSITSELSYAGQVRAAEQVAVMSRFPGMVDEVFFDTGDFVNAGDVLFTMNAVDMQNNINALEAQLATAEAAVNAARTGVAQAGGSAVQQQILAATGGVAQAETAVAQAETNVEQAALALSQAEIGYATARRNYEDTAVLFDAGVATRMQMDQVEIVLSNAEISMEQAANNYDLANVALGQARTSLEQAVQSHQLIAGEMPQEGRQRAQDALAQASAQRDSLLVNLNAARERIDDAAVRSPISGVVGSRNIEPQTMLGQGIPPFTVVSADTVLVTVNVTEVIINRIQTGQQVPVHISAASDIPFTGEVVVVSPAANEITSTFAIDISVANTQGNIRPGMFAEVFFTRERSDNAVIVPRSAVMIEDGDTVVYIADGNYARRRPVQTGIDSGTEIEIIYGLSAGEPIIITGQTFVTDGAVVLVVESGDN